MMPPCATSPASLPRPGSPDGLPGVYPCRYWARRTSQPIRTVLSIVPLSHVMLSCYSSLLLCRKVRCHAGPCLVPRSPALVRCFYVSGLFSLVLWKSNIRSQQPGSDGKTRDQTITLAAKSRAYQRSGSRSAALSGWAGRIDKYIGTPKSIEM